MKNNSDKEIDMSNVINRLFEGDCLEYMKQIPDGSVDMILCDLPYGMTQNQWDCYIPMDELWKQYNRVIKPNGAIVLTSNGNFTYGKLYVENESGDFEEAKVWSGTSHIATREDVMTYKAEWLPIIKEIVMTVNEYLVNGRIATSSIVNTISEGLMTELIQRNKELVAENITIESSKDMLIERRLKVWWNAFHEEYDKDEKDMYSAYAKSVLLN